MKDLTPDQEIIMMYKDGYDIQQIVEKVGLGIGYVTRQIYEYRRNTWGFIYIS